jgi:hypothetical protein
LEDFFMKKYVYYGAFAAVLLGFAGCSGDTALGDGTGGIPGSGDKGTPVKAFATFNALPGTFPGGGGGLM